MRTTSVATQTLQLSLISAIGGFGAACVGQFLASAGAFLLAYLILLVGVMLRRV